MSNKETKNVNKKAFFFLRHNNDIDHIVPVLYKWLTTEDIPTDIIITTKKDYLNDYRIEYLKQFKNARIIYINDLFKKYSKTYFFNRYYFKYTSEADGYIKRYNFAKKIANKRFDKIANKLFDGVDEGIVVFDWVTNHFVN
jgi:hypothetical protein